MMWVNEERKINKTIMDTVKKYKKHLEMSKNWRLFFFSFYEWFTEQDEMMMKQ